MTHGECGTCCWRAAAPRKAVLSALCTGRSTIDGCIGRRTVACLIDRDGTTGLVCSTGTCGWRHANANPAKGTRGGHFFATWATTSATGCPVSFPLGCAMTACLEMPPSSAPISLLRPACTCRPRGRRMTTSSISSWPPSTILSTVNRIIRFSEFGTETRSSSRLGSRRSRRNDRHDPPAPPVHRSPLHH